MCKFDWTQSLDLLFSSRTTRDGAGGPGPVHPAQAGTPALALLPTRGRTDFLAAIVIQHGYLNKQG